MPVSTELGAAQEQPPQQSGHEPGTADPKTVYIPPEPPANDGAKEEIVIMEKAVEAAAKALNGGTAAQPGWAAAFTWGLTYADNQNAQGEGLNAEERTR